MARYYSLSISTFADDFKAALVDYYGDGVTIESASGTTIIFACPAVCDKVLKFHPQGIGFRAYYGDTSASMKMFADSYTGTNSTGFHLVLSDAFLLLETTGLGECATSATIGKLTNGRFLVAGGTRSTNSYYNSNNFAYLTDDGVSSIVCIIAPYTYGIKHGGKMCLWPTFVAIEGKIEVNADGTFAKIPDLWVTSTTSDEVTVGSNFYLSKGTVYVNGGEYMFCNARKYVELEMD